jgi:TolB protein
VSQLDLVDARGTRVGGLDGWRRYDFPRVSADGRRIAIEVIDAGPGEADVWVLDLASGTLSRVTSDGRSHRPEWTPDGKRIAYLSGSGAGTEVRWAPADGSGPAERLYAARNIIREVTFSPDGRFIAYAANRTGNFDIWVVNRDGSGLQNLTNSAAQEIAPTWSPSGTQIAFISDRAGTNQLYVMSSSGTGVQLLVGQKVDRPTWSPLNFIAFTMESSSGHDIGIYDFSNPGAVRQLSDGRGSNESPSVAPNGRHIVFFTTRWGRQQLAIIDRTGQNIKQITEVGNNTYPNWQPITRER